MSSPVEQQPDAWQQNAIFTQLLQAPAAKHALNDLEKQLKPIFNSHAFYSLDTGMLTVKLQTLTSLLTNANVLPQLTTHDFKLGLHLAITPTLSQSASPSKNQPLHFDAFINAVAFCAYYYPPGKDPLQTPDLRLPRCLGPIEDALTTVRERLVTTADSPRSIIGKLASPETTLAFVTPCTTFPESSRTQSTTSAISQSPGAEQWFTPAQSAVRIKLFSNEQSDTSSTHIQDPDDDVNLHPVSCLGSPGAGDAIDSAPQLSEKKQDFTSLTLSCTRAEKLWHPSKPEESILENVQISSPPTRKSNIKEEIVQQEDDTDSKQQESESAIGQNTCEGNAISLAATSSSPSDQTSVDTTPRDEGTEELRETPKQTPEVSKSEPLESSSTNFSLAPSTALSHLPSPELGFESPELSSDPFTPYNASSIDPISSRKLSFSDSDDASDSSSCYENISDNEDTIMRIESAFDSSRAVEDCDENDISSDLLSSNSQVRSSNGEEGTAFFQTAMQGEGITAHDFANISAKSSSNAESDSEMERASQTQAHDFLDSGSVLSERDAFDSKVTLAPEEQIGVNENEESVALEATHDIVLSEPKISTGLPAEAFSEAGAATVRTPIAPATSTRFSDTDIEDVDEEEHTLLFENGYESDGSDLSMRTRETMSKMVEDYLSLHGSASPRYGLGKRCYVEDQELMTPDRKSHVAFGDVAMVENNTVVEDGPCLSEKAESKQARITQLTEHPVEDFGKYGDVDNSGFKLETDATGSEKDAEAFSPLLFSQKGSFSSEITPDGLNLIKKQLVLPSPFMFTDSTVGSSMSSGASGESIGKKDDVNLSEKTEKEERQALVTVPVKKENEVAERAVVCQQHDSSQDVREAEMMVVMRETLETCRVLREEIVKKQQASPGHAWQQKHQGSFGRWIEFGIFGLIVMVATLVLVERRIQRGVFLDVLV